MIKKSSKYLIIGLSLGSLLFTITPSVSAYKTYGTKWSLTKVKALRVYKGASTATSQSHWNEALYRWSVTSTPVGFTTGDPVEKDLNLYDIDDPDTNYDGYAWNTTTGDGVTHIAGRSYLNKHYTDKYTTEKSISVATHELGHLLGLAHEKGKVLMVDNTYDRYDLYNIARPTTDDINGVNSLY